MKKWIVDIMRKSECYSRELLNLVVQKRIDAKNECFEHLNREIIPMLRILKEKQIKIGLISNCFSEEVSAIKNSILFPYFDVSCLSCGFVSSVLKDLDGFPNDELLNMTERAYNMVFNCSGKKCRNRFWKKHRR